FFCQHSGLQIGKRKMADRKMKDRKMADRKMKDRKMYDRKTNNVIPFLSFIFLSFIFLSAIFLSFIFLSAIFLSAINDPRRPARNLCCPESPADREPSSRDSLTEPSACAGKTARGCGRGMPPCRRRLSGNDRCRPWSLRCGLTPRPTG